MDIKKLVGLVLCVGLSYAGLASNACIGYWRFEGNADSGSAWGVDGSAGGHTLEHNSMTSEDMENGLRFGRYINYDGSFSTWSASLVIPAGTTCLMASAWVRTTLYASGNQNIFGQNYVGTLGYLTFARHQNNDDAEWGYAIGTGLGLQATATNYFDGDFDDSLFFATVVCDYSGEKCYFYRNAALFATVDLDARSVVPATRILYMGSYNASSSRIQAGYLDEVSFYAFSSFVPGVHDVQRLMMGMTLFR